MSLSRNAGLGLATLALLGLAGVRPAQAQNLVTNPGFETGTFSGWTNTDPDLNFVDSGFAHSGAYAAFFGSVGADSTLSQTITTVAGASYNFSFYFAGDGDTPSDFSARFGTTTVFSVVDPPFESTYSLHSFTVVAATNSTTVSFAARDDPNFINLDDVSVTRIAPAAGVPEPSQTAAFGLGLLGLAGLVLTARKRKASAAA